MYVINDKGNVVKVTFGDPNMGINRDDGKYARKNFRARHQCDTRLSQVEETKILELNPMERTGAKVDN